MKQCVELNVNSTHNIHAVQRQLLPQVHTYSELQMRRLRISTAIPEWGHRQRSEGEKTVVLCNACDRRRFWVNPQCCAVEPHCTVAHWVVINSNSWMLKKVTGSVHPKWMSLGCPWPALNGDVWGSLSKSYLRTQTGRLKTRDQGKESGQPKGLNDNILWTLRLLIEHLKKHVCKSAVVLHVMILLCFNDELLCFTWAAQGPGSLILITSCSLRALQRVSK